MGLTHTSLEQITLENLIDLKRSMICIVLIPPIVPALPNEIPSCESHNGWPSALNGVSFCSVLSLCPISLCCCLILCLSLVVSLSLSRSARLLFQSLSESRRVPVCCYSVLGRSRLLSLCSVALCGCLLLSVWVPAAVDELHATWFRALANLSTSPNCFERTTCLRIPCFQGVDK
jgi:hypothetical protein